MKENLKKNNELLDLKTAQHKVVSQEQMILLQKTKKPKRRKRR